jgi:hypothetical protein
MMKPRDVREVFDTILPEEALLEAVRASGLQSRERKLAVLRPLRAMVIAPRSAMADHGRT